ncbi:MAG: KH domain-containing protein [Firmicutes bacterium]|nr:KH domain-containing protein [Bacillota bacterium]
MKELVKYIVAELVDDQDAIVITEEEGVIKISVAQKDMGKIIGKQGRIAKAIRTVVRAAGLKNGVKVNVDILEADGGVAAVAADGVAGAVEAETRDDGE